MSQCNSKYKEIYPRATDRIIKYILNVLFNKEIIDREEKWIIKIHNVLEYFLSVNDKITLFS